MFVKIFLKEWRENILIFVLAILMMAAMIALNLSGQQEMTLHFSGMFLLLFLPFAGLLIGSGGFYSEYKDNAWIYLFSRPIRKELIWIFKYVSQLSILVAIFFIFYFVRRFLPGLDRILQDLDFPNVYIRLLPLSIYVVMPLMAFTTGFSLSLLYDKQFIIFFASILVGIGLLFASQNYIEFLWIKGYRVRNHEIFYLFFALSFILSSVLTFVKADFSQQVKKILKFSKYLVIFLAVSFLLGTVWATNGQIFSSGKGFYSWNSQEYQGNFYFQSFRGGILRYVAAKARIDILDKKARIPYEKFSVRAGQIAFIQTVIEGKRWYNDLWIMDSDGTDKKPLIESHKKDSPFHDMHIGSCLLSPDGRKVAFVSNHWEKQEGRRIWVHTLWWMNTDGAQTRSHRFDVFPLKNLELMAWPPETNNIIMLIEEKPPLQSKPAQIIEFDLSEESQQVLIEDFKAPRRWSVSPDQDYMVLRTSQHDEINEIYVVLNLQTHEMNEIFSAEHLKVWGLKWSPDGRQLAYSRAKELYVYKLDEKEIKKISQRNYEYEIGFDWTSDGKKFILNAPIDGENHLVVMDESFEEIKKIKIPVPFKGALLVWGLEDQALLKGTGKGSLWRIDLETEDWKKVY